MQILDSGGTVRAETFEDGIEWSDSIGTTSGRIYDDSFLGQFRIRGMNRNVGIDSDGQVGITIGGNGYLQANGSLGILRTREIDPYLDATHDLGSPSTRWNDVYAEDVNTDGIYNSDKDWLMDLDDGEYVQFIDPIKLDRRSSTPGSASSFEGHLYFDTSKETLVFSDGVGWFACVANAY
jgi:hypothetical protein